MLYSKLMKKVSIVSFNMLGVPIAPTRMAKRFIQIAAEFERVSPDIICLQEVHTVGQLRNLVKLLPSYPYVIFRNLFNGPKGGLIIFSKIPASSSDYSVLSRSKETKGKMIMSRILRKGILSCTFEGIPLTIINTQLMANLDADWTPRNRFMPILAVQIAEVAKCVKHARKSAENILVVGDFNFPKTTDLYTQFRTKTQLDDAFSDYTSSTQHIWFLKGWKKPARIDYMFYHGTSMRIENPHHMFTKKYQITKRHKGFVSDHIALGLDALFPQ